MNWMNSIIFLFGLALGAEIVWCIMTNKHREKSERQDLRRPCEVDGDNAYFHRWAEGGIMKVCAVIEYLDGTVGLARPEDVRFIDQ